jgi:hypothetical protein
MKKQTKCEYCKKVFWSSVRKSHIIIAILKTKDGISRIVKGASNDKVKAWKMRDELKAKNRKTKEYTDIVVEKQLTIKMTMCQRCRNLVKQLMDRQKSQQRIKQTTKKIKQISKEDSARLLRATINRKVATDFRAKVQAEARKKKLAELKKKREAQEKNAKSATEQLEDVEQGKVKIVASEEQSVGDNKRKSA